MGANDIRQNTLHEFRAARDIRHEGHPLQHAQPLRMESDGADARVSLQHFCETWEWGHLTIRATPPCKALCQ